MVAQKEKKLQPKAKNASNTCRMIKSYATEPICDVKKTKFLSIKSRALTIGA